MKNNGYKAKRGGSTIISKQKIYAKIAVRSEEIVDGLFDLTQSKNENIKLGSLRVLVNKILPDLRAIDLPIEKEAIEVNMPGVESYLQRKFTELSELKKFKKKHEKCSSILEVPKKTV
ncbi:MAG TPA: hypothetical protein ENI23_12035 [bacterium]|nr:hypothetical protein [bacterium]